MLQQAVRNNAEWCDAIARVHGGDCAFTDDLWLNRKSGPRHYPNLITLDAQGTQAQTDAVEVLRALGLPRGWGVKDSFAALDLSPLGFSILFNARWFYRENLFGLEPPAVPGIAWSLAASPAELAAWHLAHGGVGTGLFRDSLLGDSRIAFIQGRRGGAIVAGAIFFKADGVCGLSNVFVPAAERDACRLHLLAHAAQWSGGLGVAGYEPEETTLEWASLGCRPLGPLRIWTAK